MSITPFSSGFDFLNAVKNTLARVIDSPRAAKELLQWYVSPSILPSTAAATMTKRVHRWREWDRQMKRHLAWLTRHYPTIIARHFTPNDEEKGRTHVLLPHEAEFPLHWTLFHALGASVAEWEDHYRSFITPHLIMQPQSPVRTPSETASSLTTTATAAATSVSSTSSFHPTQIKKDRHDHPALVTMQKMLGHAFWRACQDHSMSLTSLQAQILQHAVVTYSTQFKTRATMPLLKDIAATTRCHVNHVHRTMTMALTTGMITFQAFPHLFRLGCEIMTTKITAPTSLPYSLISKPSTPASHVTPWVITPVGRRDFLITWIVGPSANATPFSPMKNLRDVLHSFDLTRDEKTLQLKNTYRTHSIFHWINLKRSILGTNDVASEERENHAPMARTRDEMENLKGEHFTWSLKKPSKTPKPARLSKLQRKLLYFLQSEVLSVRALARQFDVEPSSVSRALLDLKHRSLIIPNVVLRFFRPVLPAFMEVRGLEVTNMHSFYHRHVHVIPEIASGWMWSSEQLSTTKGKFTASESEEGALHLLLNVHHPRAPHDLARRITHVFDLPDDAMTIHDHRYMGGLPPLMHQIIPHPEFFSTTLSTTNAKTSFDGISAENHQERRHEDHEVILSRDEVD